MPLAQDDEDTVKAKSLVPGRYMQWKSLGNEADIE